MPRPIRELDEHDRRLREPVWRNMSDVQRRQMAEYAELIEHLREVFYVLECWQAGGDDHQRKMSKRHLDSVEAALEDLEDHGHDFWEAYDL